MLSFQIFIFIFLILIAAVYYFVDLKWQNYIILSANIFFLCLMDLKSALVCFITIFFQFFVYRKILLNLESNKESKKIKKNWMLVGIAVQVITLILFKVFSTDSNPLPLGLSYYSLMLIAFLIETYWNRHRESFDFIQFTTSVSFFPILMAGPIERIGRFGQQFLVRRRFESTEFKLGLYLFILGLFKITAVSNVLASIIDHEKIGTQNIHSFGLVIYCFLSFIKIYAQFSGYIDITRGLSRFLGLKTIPNFNQPYLANNIADIWRRWHISLTLWLRDFIYLPLLLKTKNMYLGIISVTLIVGAWHGLTIEYAYWTFYWICLFTIQITFTRLNLLKSLFKINFVCISLTLLAISLSTLCFMIPYHGTYNLITRLFSMSPGGLDSLLYYAEFSLLKWLFLLLSSGVIVFYETPSFQKNFLFFKSKILFLVFLCACLGEIKSDALLYLKL